MAGEIDGDLGKAVYKEITREPGVWSERIFAKEQELNLSPVPPHKGNYVIRTTIYDAEEG